MKITSTATYAGISLLALFGLTAAGHGQAGQVQACKPVDETTGALVARSTESVRDASPEALAAFRALSLNPPRSRIVGGQLTLIGNNPWQIAMIRAVVAEPTRSQFCGGSIIRNDWILTAAHCVKNSIVREDPSRVDVVVGSSQYAIGGKRLKVAAIHRHPQYNEQTMDNDFALLRLQTPMTKGQVIQLADANTQLDDGTKICVTGWGATFEGSSGAIDLLGAEVPTVSNAVCNQPESYKGDILASMFCAGLRDGGIDSCQGDSGGPASATLQGRATLVGGRRLRTPAQIRGIFQGVGGGRMDRKHDRRQEVGDRTCRSAAPGSPPAQILRPSQLGKERSHRRGGSALPRQRSKVTDRCPDQACAISLS